MTRNEIYKLIESVLKQPYDYPAVTVLQTLEAAGVLVFTEEKK